MNLALMKKGLIKASPWILMGIGTVSHVGTVIFAVKATPKAILLLEEAEKEKLKTTGEQLTLIEKAKATWKPKEELKIVIRIKIKIKIKILMKKRI